MGRISDEDQERADRASSKATTAFVAGPVMLIFGIIAIVASANPGDRLAGLEGFFGWMFAALGLIALASGTVAYFNAREYQRDAL